MELITGSPELVFQDHQVSVSEPGDGRDTLSFIMESTGCRQRYGTPHTASDDAYRVPFDFTGPAERACKVLQLLSFIHGIQQHRGFSHDLENDRHFPGLGICTGNRQRDALPCLIHTQNDELPRFGPSGHVGGIDHHPGYGGIQCFLFQNFIHLAHLTDKS